MAAIELDCPLDMNRQRHMAPDPKAKSEKGSKYDKLLTPDKCNKRN